MKNSEVISFIDKYHYLWSVYIFDQLKNENTLDIIFEIINNSSKQPEEAVLLLLSSVRFLINKETGTDLDLDLDFFNEKNSFQNFIKQNRKKIVNLSTEKNVQANVPARALPLLELFGRKLKDKPIAVIELGASFGLIGYSLLNSEELLNEKELYFSAINQQFPSNPKSIEKYLGIEVDPPDKEWLLACIDNSLERKYATNLINNNKNINYFSLLKNSAFGFSKNNEVKNIINNYSEKYIIILTSFMLYQFTCQKQQELIDEINSFVESNNNIIWINQTVNLDEKVKNKKYYIEWNGNRIINLSDDYCKSWIWV
jgi:hypothetical protein